MSDEKKPWADEIMDRNRPHLAELAGEVVIGPSRDVIGPAPWRAGVDDARERINAVVDATGAIVCLLPILPRGEYVANARLIASAPELLALLRSQLRAVHESGVLPLGWERDTQALLNRIDGKAPVSPG